MKKIICLLFISLSAYSYLPSVESLFRNSANLDIDDRTVSANIIIKKNNFEAGSEFFATKILMNNNKYSNGEFCQLNYNNGIINTSNINKINCYNSSFKYFKDKSFKNKLFYSIVNSMLNNESSLMIAFLSELSSDVKSNKQLVNKEQRYYLSQYLNYLKSEEGENPLAPEDDARKEKMKAKLKEPYYRQSSVLKRIKVGKSFYLKLTVSNIQALFSNDTHQLLNLKLIEPGTNFEYNINFKNYVLVSGNFEAPDTISFQDSSQNEYEIKVKKISLIKEDSYKFKRRIKKYRKDFKASSESIKDLDLLL